MKKNYKIIFLGNTSVGKTMLIYRSISDGFTFPEPTIGIDFFSNTMQIGEKVVKLQLWDTAGQERYKSIITPYIRDSFLAVIVYAVNDRESFNQLKYWIELYNSKNNSRNNKILIVQNKKDLVVAGNVEDKSFVSSEEAIEFANKHNAQFVTASALDKSGIADLTESIKSIIGEDLEKHPELEEDDTINLLQAKNNNGWCC